MHLDLATTRACPLCGSRNGGGVFVERYIDPQRLDAASFASRKTPEFFSWGMITCSDCDLVFAPQIPAVAELNAQYEHASFDSAIEAEFAAQTYAHALLPALQVERAGALEVGAGTGAFLSYLSKAGFSPVVGIEPSMAAIKAARQADRGLLVHGFFPQAPVPEAPYSLVCCFMTIEHLPDPSGFCAAALSHLTPGGAVAIVSHNHSAAINRLLGRRSPIIDVEHLQLFSPATLKAMLERQGFRSVTSTTIRNRYPLSYWLKLLPLPNRLKTWILWLARMSHLGSLPVTLSVGNLLTIGLKPRA